MSMLNEPKKFISPSNWLNNKVDIDKFSKILKNDLWKLPDNNEDAKYESGIFKKIKEIQNKND